MPRFRYLISVGMGAVIALSQIESSASQTEPLANAQAPEQARRPTTDFVESSTEAAAARSSDNVANPETFPEPAVSELELSQKKDDSQNPAPSYLNPSSNPLQFPTVPEEVEIKGTQPITLQQAIELVVRNNREYQTAVLNLESAQAALREVRASMYPNLVVRSNIVQADSPSTELSNKIAQERFGSAATQSDTTTTTLDGTLELTYNLYTSGSRPAQIRAAEAQVRFNELELERLIEQLRFDVTDAYYSVQEADEQVRIARASVDNSAQSLKDAEALERAGLGTRFDVLRSRVTLANSEQDLVQAISQQHISRRQLAQILSLSQSVNISAADPVAPAGEWPLSLSESIVRAYKNRAELEQQLVQRDAGKSQRIAALASLRPQVSLFANVSVIETLDDGASLSEGYSFGGRFQWNLYDGGAASARALQAEKDIAIAETRFADLSNQIRLQVEQAFFTLDSNLTNINTAKVALDQAKESLRLARLRFQAGVGTQTEVLDAEAELTRAEGNLVAAIIGYNRALASMERAISNVGGDLF